MIQDGDGALEHAVKSKHLDCVRFLKEKEKEQNRREEVHYKMDEEENNHNGTLGL